MSDVRTIYLALKQMGLDKGYCSQLANGVRAPGLGLALEIFRDTGFKLGPIANASDREISALEKIAPPSRRAQKLARA